MNISFKLITATFSTHALYDYRYLIFEIKIYDYLNSELQRYLISYQ